MKKIEAIKLLGGSITDAAKEIGVTYQAVHDWPDELSDRIADRVIAALARKNNLDAIKEQSKSEGVA